jgi:hypothetical protein
MDVRCPVCGAQVSEWAGWCPDCGASLEQAALIETTSAASGVEEETTGPLKPPNKGQGHVRKASLVSGPVVVSRLRGSHIVLTGVVVAVALAATAAFLIPTFSTSKRGLPAALARERLFIADPGRTGIFRADGTVVEALRDLTADGYPRRGVRSGSGLVVYVHQGEAYMVPSAGGKTPVQVGAANSVFPVNGGGVGLFVGGPAGRGFVEFMSSDGQLPESGTGSTELALGLIPLARLPTGLLLEPTARSALGTFQLEVMGGHSTEVLGGATEVIDIHGSSVAWLSCTSIPPSCSLEVNETSSDVQEVIPPPRGYTGYAPGGAFSPDGTLLAAFVLRGPGQLGLEVANAVSGAVTLVGQVHGATGTAAWSADGQWLYYGGDTGDLYAQRVLGGELSGPPWRLPIPTSRNVTGL